MTDRQTRAALVRVKIEQLTETDYGPLEQDIEAIESRNRALLELCSPRMSDALATFADMIDQTGIVYDAVLAEGRLIEVELELAKREIEELKHKLTTGRIRS